MSALCERRRLAACAVIATSILHAPIAHAQRDKTGRPPPASASTKPRIVLGSDPGGVAVAILSTGINYTLPMLAQRLARDGEGDIAGLDFVDRDNRPFDVATVGVVPDASSFGVTGTSLASIVAAEAPRARLVPVRIGLGEPRAFAGAAAFVAASPARIAIVGWRSATRADWEPFATAAREATNVLFLLPAGDDGQLLRSGFEVHPAMLGLANAIVVTACVGGDALGRAGQPNINGAHVDLAVGAKDVAALDPQGVPVTLSGSAVATARLAALAARTAAAKPKMTAAELKLALLSLAEPYPPPGPQERRPTIARAGCIAEPDRMP